MIILYNRLVTGRILIDNESSYGKITVLFSRGWRHMNHGTYLLRNRLELELIHDLASSRSKDSCYMIAVLGCSTGM